MKQRETLTLQSIPQLIRFLNLCLPQPLSKKSLQVSPAMSALSKSTMPSLFNIACTTIIKTCTLFILLPVSKSNAVLRKEAKYPSRTLRKSISKVCKNSGLIMPSDQKEVKTLVSFQSENVNQLQRFQARNGFEMWVNICLAKIGTMVILFILKGLQKPYAESGKTMELLGMVSLTTEDPFLECMQSVLEKPVIFNSFLKQLPFETSEVAEDSKDFQKSAELAINFPKDSENDKKSLDSDKFVELSSLKATKTCFSCKESIEKKKFFGERRFGILEKCNCMLCYGCIRKVSGTSDGVVKGPVCCPFCSVKSDTVASTRRWIENEEKIQFFETFNKNLHGVSKKRIVNWTSFPPKDDAIWIREPKMGNYSETFRKDLRGADAKPNMEWTKLALKVAHVPEGQQRCQ